MCSSARLRRDATLIRTFDLVSLPNREVGCEESSSDTVRLQHVRSHFGARPRFSFAPSRHATCADRFAVVLVIDEPASRRAAP